MKDKHLLVMLLCCLIPILAFVAIAVLAIPLSTVAFWGLLLLCPLGHFFLMRGTGHEGHQHPAEAAEETKALSDGSQGPT